MDIIRRKNRHLSSKSIGEPSSKYGYNPEKFNEDMQRHADEIEALYNDFKNWMIKKNVDPMKFRGLFRRYYEDFIE